MIIKHISIFQADTCFPGVLRLPEAAGPAPAVVFHNGYCAYMQMYDAMAEAFCRAGYVTLQYDGRGTYGAQKGGFLCGTQWLEDAACAVGYLTGLPEVDGERIGAAGVSMGGAITIMQGAADPRVKCLYAMAPVTTGRTLIEGGWCRSRGREAWEEFSRALLSDAARAAQGFPSAYVDAGYGCFGVNADPAEVEAECRLHPHKARELSMQSLLNCYLYVDARSAAERLRIPLCMVQGAADTTVLWADTKAMYDAAAAPEKEWHLLPGAGHVLPEEACGKVTALGLAWFDRHLRPENKEEKCAWTSGR